MKCLRQGASWPLKFNGVGWFHLGWEGSRLGGFWVGAGWGVAPAAFLYLGGVLFLFF